MESNFYVGDVCHRRRFFKSEYIEKIVLYSTDGFNYLDLLTCNWYTTDRNCKDYVDSNTIISTDISQYRTDYIYLLSKYNGNRGFKRKLYYKKNR